MAKNEQPSAVQDNEFEDLKKRGQRLDRAPMDGMFKTGEGAWFAGYIEYAFTFDHKRFGNATIIVVKLGKPCKFAQDREKKPTILKEGQMMGVTMTAGLSELAYYIDGKAKIAVKATDKRSLGDGREMWNYEVILIEGKRSERPYQGLNITQSQSQGDSSSGDLSDIPF